MIFSIVLQFQFARFSKARQWWLRLVPSLIANLQAWLSETDAHPLIAGAVFHYEFEFIHPFVDGNGRIGRLWQTCVLAQWKPLFADIPVESMIYERQAEYYAVLRQCGAAGNSTIFIESMLQAIVDTLAQGEATTDLLRRGAGLASNR